MTPNEGDAGLLERIEDKFLNLMDVVYFKELTPSGKAGIGPIYTACGDFLLWLREQTALRRSAQAPDVVIDPFSAVRAADKSLQFCPHCGAGVGKWHREGEGRCPDCPTEVIYTKK